MDIAKPLDHGGNLDEACRMYGGARSNWLDLSTGINPNPYPIGEIDPSNWNGLPDKQAFVALESAARVFWNVPETMDVLAAPGCSAIIAQIPTLFEQGAVYIPGPTYNEHEAAFVYHGWKVVPDAKGANLSVIVHPNNPTGTFHTEIPQTELQIVDESFCDVAPGRTLIHDMPAKGGIVLKSFGKFWGLAGLRLGFAIGDPELIADLRKRLGPWAVSGPALAVGTRALQDQEWAQKIRTDLEGAQRQLDQIILPHVEGALGDVSLFRTYVSVDAKGLHERLARHHIWTRLFPYNPNWIRIGLPPQNGWARLEAALR
ncbi:MAG: threonine-phosphate decarboxylase [Planktomarina sp.]